MIFTVLVFGDVMGDIAKKALAQVLPVWKKKYQVHFVIANAEHFSHGRGVSPRSIEEGVAMGVNAFTSGNHIWHNTQSAEVVSPKGSPVLRPANFPEGNPGEGVKLFEIGVNKVLVINLLGRVFMTDDVDCPFRTLDAILSDPRFRDVPMKIVDFHAEATSEKFALARHSDGRLSILFGTHTHVATADLQTLSQGTTYITDVGMVGYKDGVIGEKSPHILKRFLLQQPLRHDIPEAGRVMVNGLLVQLDTITGKAVGSQMLYEEVSIG